MNTRPLLLSFTLLLALAACDKPADKSASAEQDLPEAMAPSAGTESVTDQAETAAADDSSMAEDSPAGEGVTAEEIPHSDVPPPSRAVFTDADCNYEGWVGKPVDEDAIKETGRPFRILEPDSMMTMDHSPDRINVVHDKDGVVTRVWCG